MLEQEAITPTESAKITKALNKYALSDTQIFDLVLAPGQYLAPVAMSRQGSPNKWAQRLEDDDRGLIPRPCSRS